MVVLFVVIPLFCAFFSPVIGKAKERLAAFMVTACSAALLLLSAGAVFWAKAGARVYYMGGWKPPFGISLVLDGLSALSLLVINLIGFLALVYSIDYVKKFTSEHLYYTLFSLLLAGLNGVALSGDLFNLFVFIEITSIASYSLIAFGLEDNELEASFKYLVLGSVASMLILLSIGLLYASLSTLNMADVGLSLISAGPQNSLVLFCLTLFIVGFGIKVALVPFHTWLPDAHPAAPAPVSAMLSGVVIKTIGVYALIRVVFNVIGFTALISSVLSWLGIISMVIGVLLAIGQWDFKRLLAYHSISQIGYVIFAIGLGTPLGIIGGLFHLFNHSLFKSLLFLNAGSVEYATGVRDLDKLSSVSREMPVTSNTSLIASLSISGIPPFCGFWSKFIIIIAALQAHHIAGAVVAIAVSMVTLASFLKVQKYAFIKVADKLMKGVKEVPVSMTVSMTALALLCVVVGVFFLPFINWAIKPAAQVLIEGMGYVKAVLGV